MNGGPSIIRRPTVERSNTELVTSLRTHISTAQQISSSVPLSDGSYPSNDSDIRGFKRPHFRAWTRQEGDTLYVPAIDWSLCGLAEERSQYDITAKLFYLPNVPPWRRCAHTKEAIELVLKELGVQSVDLLIVSFPGIAFDADDDEDGSHLDQAEGSQDVEAIAMTWRTLEKLHADGTISQLGLAEFGSQRLARLLPRTKVRPSVNHINIRDCYVFPKNLILYAKLEGIELLTHNDCTDILPLGTVRELLGSGERGAGVLGGNSGLSGEVEPQWVVKYTAVVKDRGVVENKGYFAMTELLG